ncbi:DegV family protein [bacterium]|nr:DegV family protein [bacterium]
MKKIGLVCDEGADLPKEIIEKYQIAKVPLKVNWPEGFERLPGETVFHKMQEADKRGIKIFCKTSQPSPKDFLEIFQKQLENFEKVICITITSKLSGTFNSALQAKNILPSGKAERVFVVDSLNAVCGEGLLVLRAAELITEGKEIKNILQELEDLKQRIHLIAILGDPKWLEVSGRLSSTLANWIRKMQKIGIRPLIGIKDGVLKAIGIKTGVKDVPQALFQELEVKTKKTRKEGKRIRMALLHCLNKEGMKKLREMIEKDLENTEIVFENLIDRVVGSIVGPGTLGLAWYEL